MNSALNMKNDFDMPKTPPSSQQLSIIQQQLGRKPRGIACVASETSTGIPLVLQMHSLVDSKPFPTLYWLCSRDINKAIAKIETNGFIKETEDRLQNDAELRHAYLANQQTYVDNRWQEMTTDEKEQIERLGFSDLFDQYGIGGIAHWDKVRCLHMQYAHYLATRNNVIGALLDKTFSLDQLKIQL